MPDGQSLPLMLYTDRMLFGQRTLASVAKDRRYFTYDNEQLLIQLNVTDIYLPHRRRAFKRPKKLPLLQPPLFYTIGESKSDEI